ncbi:acyltransferase family protein [Halioglobus maricola]|nr:acyltransferase family protein [Halioglobus maricola]
MMLLGVVLHACQLYMVNPVLDYYWDPARSLSMDVLLFWINTYRMPVFFLLSGFFTAMLLERHGPKAMFENRYRRIVVPFIIFLPPLAIIMTTLRIVARNVMATGETGFDLSYIENPAKLWNNTHNLWFLYYLMLYLGTVWLALKVRPKCSHGNNALTRRPIQSLATMVPLCLTLALLGSLNWPGRARAELNFIPALDVYLVYGICFGFGWLLYRRIDDLDTLAEKWKPYMIFASVMCAVALVTLLAKGTPDDARYLPMHALLSLVTGFSVGYYMLAFVGLFSRHCASYNPWTRYLSDSAYWIFIFHSIPMVMLAIPLHGWEVAAEWKFLVICTATSAICLASYQLFVRNSWIGQVLNGQRSTTVPWRKN